MIFFRNRPYEVDDVTNTAFVPLGRHGQHGYCAPDADVYEELLNHGFDRTWSLISSTSPNYQYVGFGRRNPDNPSQRETVTVARAILGLDREDKRRISYRDGNPKNLKRDNLFILGEETPDYYRQTNRTSKNEKVEILRRMREAAPATASRRNSTKTRKKRT